MRIEAEFQDGKINGFGTTYNLDGDKIFEGHWENDDAVEGTMYLPDGRRYVGQVLQNVFNGNGTLFESNGDKLYEGSWVEGEPHGRGTLAYDTGDFVEGDFLKGEVNGKCSIFEADGTMLYEGEMFYD